MAFKRKLRKLLRNPRLFFEDAFNNSVKEKPASVSRQLPVITLMVPVSGKAAGLHPFLRSVFETAGGGNGAVEVALLVQGADDAALAALEHVRPWPAEVTLVKYDGTCVFDAIDDFLPLSKGEWTGFSSLNAIYGANFFTVLRQELSLQFELAAAVTEISFGSGAKTRHLNAVIKSPRKVSILSSSIVPMIDLENVFLRRAILVDVIETRNLKCLPRGTARGLCDTFLYFQSLGEATIKVFPSLHKRMTVKRSVVDRLGIGAADTVEGMVGNLLALARLCHTESELPPWMQLRVAYAVFNLFDYHILNRSAFDDQDPGEMETLDDTIRSLMRFVRFELIEDKCSALAKWSVRYGVYYRYLGICPLVPPAYFDEFDPVAGLVRMRMLVPYACELSISKNGRPYKPAFTRVTEQRFCDSVFLFEHIVWISVMALTELGVDVNHRLCPMFIKGKRVNAISGAVFDNYIARPIFSFLDSPRHSMVRYLAGRGVGSERYRDCWLFIDKDAKADDNAEHLYRWVMHNAPEKNKSFFVLRKNCKDWMRLKSEGFNLLEFGSLRHELALLNASWLFSSHAAPFVVNVLPRKYFADMLRYKFCFLQHGVTKDDQSAWLNSRSIDMLVTVSKAELQSMTSGLYKYTLREAALTGFPRYDALHNGRSAHPKRLIIMPTWRLHLSGELQGKTSVRSMNPAFAGSDYCREWGAFLSNEQLMSGLVSAGYEVVFLAHPNIQPYLDFFHLAPSVTHADLEKTSIQDYLTDCALLITDYSSVAFDVAYLRRPVLYFQFDHDSFFALHTYGRGYYDYETDGFGPVVYTVPDLVTAVSELQTSKFELMPVYKVRIERFFEFDDAENSRRVYEGVLKRSSGYFHA